MKNTINSRPIIHDMWLKYLSINEIGFGKHTDKTWQELPKDYLKWLASQEKETSNIAKARAELTRRHYKEKNNVNTTTT